MRTWATSRLVFIFLICFLVRAKTRKKFKYLFSQRCYDRVVHLSVNHGAISLDDDIVLFAVVHYWFLLAEGVELNYRVR